MHHAGRCSKVGPVLVGLEKRRHRLGASERLRFLGKSWTPRQRHDVATLTRHDFREPSLAKQIECGGVGVALARQEIGSRIATSAAVQMSNRLESATYYVEGLPARRATASPIADIFLRHAEQLCQFAPVET